MVDHTAASGGHPADRNRTVEIQRPCSTSAGGQNNTAGYMLAICTPSASTLTQMAQVYGKDADYASAINVVTTLLCIVTMPLMVALYQM